MKTKIIIILTLTILSLCSFKSNYSIDNYSVSIKKSNKRVLTKNLNIDITQTVSNAKDVLIQLEKIKTFSPKLYIKNIKLYKSIKNWLKSNGDITKLESFGIHLYKFKKLNNYGNIKITSYYTPIIHARKTPSKKFCYPIYRIPEYLKKIKRLPNRKDIYNGILQKKYILAYSNSLIDNFIMDVQGSGIINYGSNQPLVLFKYSGENGWPYTSIGKILVDKGDIKKEDMSIKTIINWCKKHTQIEIKKLLENNNSFVFFKPTKNILICGSSSVPLVARTSIATDQKIIKLGDVILAKIPILNKFGKFYNLYETRLLIALDVGGSIKGQKLDLYQGIGNHAGITAGFYNHYGYVWNLQ
ncbi:MAG: murein transglycosylase A [Buchnera aphidicola (Schlechtendalia peitan)]